jgi:hypothetical protein
MRWQTPSTRPIFGASSRPSVQRRWFAKWAEPEPIQTLPSQRGPIPTSPRPQSKPPQTSRQLQAHPKASTLGAPPPHRAQLTPLLLTLLPLTPLPLTRLPLTRLEQNRLELTVMELTALLQTALLQIKMRPS